MIPYLETFWDIMPVLPKWYLNEIYKWVENSANVIITFKQNPSSYLDAGYSAFKNYVKYLKFISIGLNNNLS
jgi:hypothetical protein